MTTASHARNVTGGVDTHSRVHVAAVIDSTTQQLLGTASFPVSAAGYQALHSWLEEHGAVDAVGIEGTGTYGAGLTRRLSAAGLAVREVNRPDRAARRMHGKSDPLDAEAAARAVIAGRATGLPKSRDGHVEAIRMLRLVYRTAVADRTQAINQIHALISTAPEQVREELAGITIQRQLQRVRSSRERSREDLVQRVARQALRELASRVHHLDEQIERMDRDLTDLTEQVAPSVIDLAGVGFHTAAQLLVTIGDNPNRLVNEAAFARLCGVAPVPASSGNRTRHRLDRAGDRDANHALWRVVMARIAHGDPRTLDYLARRTREGLSKQEIIRCLKRYVAREVYRAITTPRPPAPTGQQIRQLRMQIGVTQLDLAETIGLPNTTISRLERGQLRRGDLQRRCYDALAQHRAASA